MVKLSAAPFDHLDRGNTTRALEALIDANFLETDTDSSYRFHGFVRRMIRRHALAELRPTSTAVEVSRLVKPGALVEIEATAGSVVPRRSPSTRGGRRLGRREGGDPRRRDRCEPGRDHVPRGRLRGRGRELPQIIVSTFCRDLGCRLSSGEEVVDHRRGVRCRHREAHLVGRQIRDGHIDDFRM